MLRNIQTNHGGASGERGHSSLVEVVNGRRSHERQLHVRVRVNSACTQTGRRLHECTFKSYHHYLTQGSAVNVPPLRGRIQRIILIQTRTLRTLTLFECLANNFYLSWCRRTCATRCIAPIVPCKTLILSVLNRRR